tara:strand:- start:508 stop:1269 length:762 start_codon:yes stop_codon:yes gene_type:complete
MEVLTVVFTHWKWDFMKPFYEWHKERVKDLRYIWDVSDLEPEEIAKVEDPNIMPMKLENLWANISNYFPACLNWFQREQSKYFCLMEADSLIATDDFVSKSVSYMKKNEIDVLFPWLKSQWSDPEHPFVKRLQSLHAKHWTIPGLSIFTNTALQYYGQAGVQVPMYWNEIRLPTVLADAGFHITCNPYTHLSTVHTAEGNKEERKNKSLTKEEIEKGIYNGYKAFHPIKDPSLLDYIKELQSEKEKIKAAVPK